MTSHPTPDVLALVALGEDVDAEVLGHVEECRSCFHELGALQQVVAIGRSLEPDDRLVAPHPRVWQRISAEVEGGRVMPLRGEVALLDPPVAAPTGSGRRSSGRRSWATVAVAAAAALVVGLGGGFALKGLLDSGPDVATTQLNALPGYPGASGTATVEDRPDGQRALVVAVELPATTSVDGTMEVWMSDTHAQDMVPMGTMTGSTARFPIPASFDLTTHPVVDVSLEPRNDTDAHHSDVSVVRGRLNV